MPQAYWINRLSTVEDVDRILDLAHAVHGDTNPALNRDYLRWRYFDHPPFTADVYMAEHEGKAIGLAVSGPFDFQWGETHLRGTMYAGMLTHPAHQRRGIFGTLVRCCNELAAQRGLHFIMGMPNEAALPGYLKFGGWTYYRDLIPLFVKPISIAAIIRPDGSGVLRRLDAAPRLLFRRRTMPQDGAPALDVRRAERVPPEFDAVAEAFARDVDRLMIRRTPAYWNWRYAQRPGAEYHTYLAHRGGRAAGMVVTSAGRQMGRDIGMIVDLAAEGGLPVLRRLIRQAESDLLDRGVGMSACQATSPLLCRALVEEGYWRVPAKLMPKRFHYIYRPTGVHGLPREPKSLSDWHLTFGDSDNV